MIRFIDKFQIDCLRMNFKATVYFSNLRIMSKTYLWNNIYE
jgi:hypothetical protein